MGCWVLHRSNVFITCCMRGELLNTLNTFWASSKNEFTPRIDLYYLKAQTSRDCIRTLVVRLTHSHSVWSFITEPISQSTVSFLSSENYTEDKIRTLRDGKLNFFKGYKCWQNICVLLLSSPWLSFLLFLESWQQSSKFKFISVLHLLLNKLSRTALFFRPFAVGRFAFNCVKGIWPIYKMYCSK